MGVLQIRRAQSSTYRGSQRSVRRLTAVHGHIILRKIISQYLVLQQGVKPPNIRLLSRPQDRIDVYPLKEADVPKSNPVLSQPIMADEQ